MEINYKISGKGKETALFLHGWGENLNSFNFFSDSLKNNYKTVQVDFCGFGESKKIPYVFGVFDYAVEIYKLIKQENLNNLIIVSHSFGTRVAILLANWFNVNIKKFIVIGGAGIKPRFNIITKFKIYKYKVLKFLVNKKIIKKPLKNYGSSDYKNLNPIEKQTFNKIIGFNLKKFLRYINIPTLLIWGSDDNSTPVYMAKIFNKEIKNSKLKIIKNADHFCFLTHKEIVLFEINNFLNFV